MLIRNTILFLCCFSRTVAQFGTVDLNFDTRLLRSDEKQEIVNLNSDIVRFFTTTGWDESYSDLKIPLHIQIVFEGITAKGNEKIYNCQALFSNGRDLRYFDKSVQFIYNSGTSLYYDPILFEPLSGFLAYYGNLILAGEIDTYEFNGGNASYEIAREIGIRGSGSMYKNGWSARINQVDDIHRNIGLRKARLSWYIAMDLFKNGDIDGTLEEINSTLDGIEQSFRDFGRDNHTQYFLKVHSEKIAKILSMLGRKELLKDMKELDPDRRDLYQSALDTISK
ncbi:MAG: DUF4835 family protein [Candidatus Marinimicrobia bacterium]|nr:DUF4835 family protein [Candidatus Neomarinimicrobiota bacterium]MBT7515592.1 DUF4835 family protein [Candidatus Neomarinimicrobiota bacterium]